MPSFSSPLWLLLLTLVTPLPVGTEQRRQRVPWVTYTLIAVNTVVFFLTSPDAFARWGFTPLAPRLPTLLTYQFLHENLGHLLWNMAFLWLFGPHVEEALGPVSFAALYFGGGLAAGLLHMAIALLLAPRAAVALSPLIGASGAISAILAPFAVRFHRAQIRLFWLPGLLISRSWSQWETPAIWGLGIWLLQNLAGALYGLIAPSSGGTAYWAHLGGFMFGLVAAELTQLFREGRQEYLLQDARAAATRGQEALSLAVQKYRTFLDHDPENAVVHGELARALARRARQDPEEGDDDRREAAAEFLIAARLLQKSGGLTAAVQCVADARGLGLSLPLTSRERLRLAAAAADAQDSQTAIALLRALIAQTPDAPEDEMARLRLGQLLLPTDPAQARVLFASFLDKYPYSQWARLVHDLQSRAN